MLTVDCSVFISAKMQRTNTEKSKPTVQSDLNKSKHEEKDANAAAAHVGTSSSGESPSSDFAPDILKMYRNFQITV